MDNFERNASYGQPEPMDALGGEPLARESAVDASEPSGNVEPQTAYGQQAATWPLQTSQGALDPTLPWQAPPEPAAATWPAPQSEPAPQVWVARGAEAAQPWGARREETAPAYAQPAPLYNGGYQPAQPQAAYAPNNTYGAYPLSDMPRQGGKKRAGEKTSFKSKAILVCTASVLGFGTLGLGLSAGGALVERMYPAKVAQSTAASQRANNGADYVVPTQPRAHAPATDSLSGTKKNVASIVKNVSEAVVSINVSASMYSVFGGEVNGAGSGIIFYEDEEKVYIATNNHVIQDADTVTVSEDDETQISASFVGRDPQSDLAVISVKKSDLTEAGISYKLAAFGDSSLLEVGDEAIAIGNAMGEGKTATMGIISAINKQISIDGKTLDVIQTDAAINRGNSGGALVNSNGEVIGINTAKLESAVVEGMGYSIPSNIAKGVLDDLRVNGSIQKPFLGINGKTISEDMLDMYNLPSVGVYVYSVVEGGGAEKAGLQATDIIVGFNGAKISTMEELSEAIAVAAVGDAVKIHIYRDGSLPMEIDAELGNLNEDPTF